jgi:hypothetical protein
VHGCRVGALEGATVGTNVGEYEVGVAVGEDDGTAVGGAVVGAGGLIDLTANALMVAILSKQCLQEHRVVQFSHKVSGRAEDTHKRIFHHSTD